MSVPENGRSITSPSLLELFQGFASIAVVIVGTLYVVGLLIVNVNLSGYGIVSLDLARPEYAMAGTLWCFFTAVVTAGFDVAAARSRKYSLQRQYGRLFVALPFDIGMVLLLVLFVLTLISRGSVGLERRTIAMVVVLLWNGLTVDRFLQKIKTAVRTATVSADLLVYVVIILTGISGYAAVVYPSLPREFGGGQKAPVRLFFAEPQPRAWLAGLNLPLSETDRSLGPVDLLIENDKFFIVARTDSSAGTSDHFLPTLLPTLRGSTAIGIDRRLVSAVVYLPRVDPKGWPPEGGPSPSGEGRARP